MINSIAYILNAQLANSYKYLVNINSSFCRGLKKLHLLLICKSLTHFSFHFSITDIRFVPDQYYLNIFLSMLTYLSHPVFFHTNNANISVKISLPLEGVPIIYSVHKNNPMCSFVICLSNIAESFLPSSIPDLHLNLFSVQIKII